MLRFLLKEYAQKLNTLTKYPSILTFHNLGVKKGTLIDTLTSDKFPKSDDEELEGTEKVDGCFHYDTSITLADGSKEKIGKIVSNKMEVEVMTYNFKKNIIEPKKITNWFNYGKKKKFICIKYQSPLRQGGRVNNLICTEDHLLRTNTGWKEAQYINKEDIVYTFCEKLTHVQEQLILGGLLGDSFIYPTIKNGITISRNRGIAYCHSNKQLEYVEFKNNILDSYFLKKRSYMSGFGSEGTESSSICCKPIEEIISLCVDTNGNKKINEKWLDNISPIGLAFWYMDDGSLNVGTNNQKEKAIFHTEGFSEKEIDLLIEKLKIKYNIESKKIFYKNKYFRLDLNTKGSDILFNIISPYIIKTMQYKLPLKYRMEYTFWDYYKNYNTTNKLYPIKIIGQCELPNHITNFNNYDLEVEDNHNYFAGGILVHNSNSRIIICGEDYAIGMREDIIYVKGDKTINDKLGVLSNCIPIAERIVKENSFDKNTLVVIYGEHYGFNVGANYKNYAKGKNTGFRVFDVWDMPISEILELFEKYDLNRLSTWRKQENQPFYPIDKLDSFVTTLGLKRTPVLFKIRKGDLKMSIEDMYQFLLMYKDTIVGLDNNGKSEGFVVRSKDRKYIKKIRLEEYEKTLRLIDLEVEKLKKMLSN